VVKWQDANKTEQDIFLNKAYYLISNGYANGDIEDLAMKIYYTSLRKSHGAEQD
jgi:hypothetical protein